MTEMMAAIRNEKKYVQKDIPTTPTPPKTLEDMGFKPLCEDRLSLGRILTTDSYTKYILCPPYKLTAYNDSGEFTFTLWMEVSEVRKHITGVLPQIDSTKSTIILLPPY